MGQELAGEVEAVGTDVTRFEPGDRVAAATDLSMGGYAEYVCLKANGSVASIPDDVRYAEAAAIPVGGMNALLFMRKAEIQRDESVLIIGAGGSIGTCAVQLAKRYGAQVTAVDRGDKLDMLREIGADHVIDYTAEDFTRNGKRYDVIFDVIGKGYPARNVPSLASGGRYLQANPGVGHDAARAVDVQDERQDGDYGGGEQPARGFPLSDRPRAGGRPAYRHRPHHAPGGDGRGAPLRGGGQQAG